MLSTDYLNTPPATWEKVMLGNREILFLSTHDDGKTKTLEVPPDLEVPREVRQYILKQTPDYMDIGSATIDHNVNGTVLYCIYINLLLISLGFFFDFPYLTLWLLITSFIALTMLIVIMVYYIVRRRRRTTVRFYRQTQQVCFKPSPKSSFIKIDWHSLVPYIKAGRMRGSQVGSWFDVNALCLAWFDEKSNTLHTFYHGENNLLTMFTLDEWNVIKRYMNGDELSYTSPYKLVPNSEVFKAKRENVWKEFVNNEHKRWFALNIRNMSVSYFSIAIYYFFLILGFWRIPYLFCDLYFALSVKPFLPKETHSLDTEHQHS